MVPEQYINIIKDMYEDCSTSVRTDSGLTSKFQIEVGLHQRSALSPLLFVIIMDILAEDINEDSPWAMLFADDLVLSPSVNFIEWWGNDTLLELKN